MSDPKEILEEKCAQTEKCRPLLEAYQKCAARVESRGEANKETCVEELFESIDCFRGCWSYVLSGKSGSYISRFTNSFGIKKRKP
jgi:hypothetical protein